MTAVMTPEEIEARLDTWLHHLDQEILLHERKAVTATPFDAVGLRSLRKMLADLRRQLDEARAERNEYLAFCGRAISAGTPEAAERELAEARAECMRLRAERLNLDRRIHNQRVALRQNWMIVDMRAGHLRNKEVRSKYLGYWAKAEAKAREARAECERQRKRAEKAEAAAEAERERALEPSYDHLYR